MNQAKSVIGFKDLKISCIIGVWPFEREQKQDIFVDLEVESSFERCSKSDNFNDTIDYAFLAKIVEEIAIKRQFRLLETFSEECLNYLFCTYPISWAKITIKKPMAIPNASFAFVQLEKCR
jgi:dihydroneopterin aldolase